MRADMSMALAIVTVAAVCGCIAYQAGNRAGFAEGVHIARCEYAFSTAYSASDTVAVIKRRGCTL